MRRVRGESGQSSLVEIGMTLLILGIVMAFLFTNIESAQRVVTATKLRITNVDEARTLMAVLTKDIRTATRLTAGTSPFVSANSRDVVFYANLDNPTGGPRKVHIYIDSSNEIIAETRLPDSDSVAPNYTYTGPAKLRYVGRYLANTNLQPVFEYLDSDGTSLPVPLSDADKLLVAAVRITLVVKASTTLSVGATTLVDSVRLPNVEYQTTG